VNYGLLFLIHDILSLVFFSAVLCIIGLFNHSKSIGKFLKVLWLAFGGLIVFGIVLIVVTNLWADFRDVHKKDLYGEYVIDRRMFRGKQADWQYNNYRFELTEKGEILFHITDKSRIIKTEVCQISFVENYRHPRLKIAVTDSTFNVIDGIPTLYVNGSDFYYVFESSRYGNMFFTKGKWKPLD